MNNDIFDCVVLVIDVSYFYDLVYFCIYEVVVVWIVKNNFVLLVMFKVFFEDDEGFKEFGGFVYFVCFVGVVILVYVVKDYVQMIYDMVIWCELIGLGQLIFICVIKMDVIEEFKEQIVQVEQVFYKFFE